MVCAAVFVFFTFCFMGFVAQLIVSSLGNGKDSCVHCGHEHSCLADGGAVAKAAGAIALTALGVPGLDDFVGGARQCTGCGRRWQTGRMVWQSRGRTTGNLILVFGVIISIAMAATELF